MVSFPASPSGLALPTGMMSISRRSTHPSRMIAHAKGRGTLTGYRRAPGHEKDGTKSPGSPRGPRPSLMPEFTTLGPGPNGQDRRGGVGAVRTSENTPSTTFGE